MPAVPKLFLIQVPMTCTEPPIGLAQLYGYANARGMPAEVMDISIALYHRNLQSNEKLWSQEMNAVWRDEDFVRQFLERDRPWIESVFLDRIVSAERPIVGFSCTEPNLAASFLMARWIKERRPDALIVLGGQTFTMLDAYRLDLSIARPEIDAIVIGDGEETLEEIFHLWGEGRDLQTCRGLLLRDPAGAARRTPPRPWVNLDALPFADYTVFDLPLYGTIHLAKQDMVLMASRGCVRHCSFCGFRTGSPGFRQMSGERVHAEIMHQRRVLPNLREDSRIKFYDLLVNGDMHKLERLCGLLAGEQAPVLPWRSANAIVRPEMTVDVCRRLRAAGAGVMILGLESGSQHVLDLMEKGQTLDEMKAVLRNIDAAGLETRANFMVGHPGETEEDFQQTLRFIEEMRSCLHSVYPSYGFTHLSGPLEKDPERWGVPREQDNHYWESADGTNTYPVRLDRYRRFLESARSIGVHVNDGLEMPLEAFVDFMLGRYHEHRKDAPAAREHYRRYLSRDPGNEFVAGRLRELSPAETASRLPGAT
jgi:radical SAM superfamily enzyme YgiQ (UPF0313 family)